MEKEPKFGIGDKVKIVNYGSEYWIKRTERELYVKAGFAKNVVPNNLLKEVDGVFWADMSPELVGQEGLVIKVSVTQGIPKYALEGPNKTAWYHESQLEMINKNPNR